MPTQLEIIVEALERKGKPMTAEELGQVLRDNGSDAERPENNVSGLVSTNKGVLETSKVDGVTFYSLSLGATSRQKGKTSVVDRKGGFEAFRGLCARLSKVHCKSEEEVKIGLVKPILESIGYDFEKIGIDVSLEENHDGDHTDVTLIAKGKQKILVEVKRPDVLLDSKKNLKQLKDYVHSDENAAFGILTNGKEWIFFYQFYRKKPVIISFFKFSIEKPTEEAYAQLQSLSKDGFNKSKKMDEAKRSVDKMVARWKSCIDDAIDGMIRNTESFFVNGTMLERLKDEVSSAVDRWVKNDLSC